MKEEYMVSAPKYKNKAAGISAVAFFIFSIPEKNLISKEIFSKYRKDI